MSEPVKRMLPFATNEELSRLARRIYAEQGDFRGFGGLRPMCPAIP
ncbi:MAG: hypothetical protein ACOYJA_11255 [Christensenellales bacterium]